LITFSVFSKSKTIHKLFCQNFQNTVSKFSRHSLLSVLLRRTSTWHPHSIWWFTKSPKYSTRVMLPNLLSILCWLVSLKNITITPFRDGFGEIQLIYVELFNRAISISIYRSDVAVSEAICVIAFFDLPTFQIDLANITVRFPLIKLASDHMISRTICTLLKFNRLIDHTFGVSIQ
jgi:hypothetical protein